MLITPERFSIITLDENIRGRIEKRGLMLPHSKLHLLLYMYGLLLQRGPTIITFIERDSKQNISLICNKSFCSQLSQSESVRPSADSSTVTTLHVGWFPIDRLILPLFLM